MRKQLLALACTLALGIGAYAAIAAGAPPSLTLVQRTEHRDLSCREPAVLVMPSGRLFVAGYGHDDDGEVQRTPRLWTSDASGAAWARVPLGTEAEGAEGNSDVALAASTDGTIYLASMIYDRSAGPDDPQRRGGIRVGVSHDEGRTWQWQVISRAGHDDRPWVLVAPDGVAHLFWNDGTHVNYSRSTDAGRTWSATRSLHAGGGSSHAAVGAAGELAVRVVPWSASGARYHPGVDLLLVSLDAGQTWVERPVPGVRHWETPEGGGIPRWVEPVAWGPGRTLHLLWAQADGVHFADSADLGQHWSQTRILATREDDPYFFPSLLSRSDGSWIASWYVGSGESLRWQAAVIRRTPGGALRVRSSAPMPVDAWEPSAFANAPPVRSAAGEYVGLAALPSGDLAVVTPVQDGLHQRFGFVFNRLHERRD